ncbi:MAG: shikimate kinase [Clostridia bacterium]|nr:shikimate kinase [Clostridia bacterium]
MKNIVLIGMPGCGKSTVGRYLAKALGVDFVDCDSVIEQTEGTEISKIFNEHGEEYFRKLETQALKKLSAAKNSVIATGGGCVERRENFEILKDCGTVIFINRPLEDILGDIDTSKRPLLADGKNRLYRLYERRLPLYLEACDIEIKNILPPQKLAEKIIDEVKL